MAGPIRREGAVAPSWSWLDVKAHFEIHQTRSWLARPLLLRKYQIVSEATFNEIQRVEGGEREVDARKLRAWLDVAKEKSKEQLLLDQMESKRAR